MIKQFLVAFQYVVAEILKLKFYTGGRFFNLRHICMNNYRQLKNFVSYVNGL